MKKNLLTAFAATMILNAAFAQEKPTNTATAIEKLPGKGLAQHDFFYAGEGNKIMSIVKGGKIVWTYTDTAKRGEISDAVLLSNGNVLFAHQYGVTEITKDKKLVWDYPAPAKTEIHTAEPIGKSKILYIQNGNPAKMMVVNIETGKNEFEMELPVKDPLLVHGQFRHVSITGDGTALVANMSMGQVCEYDDTGKMIWSVDVPSPWAAERLKNGNTLVSSNNKFVREVNKKGETVWEVTPADFPGLKFSGFQRAQRLANGNTLIGNWAARGDGKEVQAIEVSPEKKLVWALRSWDAPEDLGRSTNIQILDDQKVVPENVHFGKIK